MIGNKDAYCYAFSHQPYLEEWSHCIFKIRNTLLDELFQQKRKLHKLIKLTSNKEKAIRNEANLQVGKDHPDELMS